MAWSIMVAATAFAVVAFVVISDAFVVHPSQLSVTRSTGLSKTIATNVITDTSSERDMSDPSMSEMPKYRPRPSQYTGECFVLGDNIDTDQIIPAEFLTLVPTKIEEYNKLGSYALDGLPPSYKNRYVKPGEVKTQYPIIIAGDNFGCGSSREHAPIALGASGNRIVIAESFARIFFRNCIATGELYPYETTEPLVNAFSTGDEVTVDLEADTVKHHASGKVYNLVPLGDAGPVINAGGLFPYARKEGMIKKAETT